MYTIRSKDVDWEGKIVQCVVHDAQYTDFETFVKLQVELIQYQHYIGQDVRFSVALQTL